MPKQNHIFKHPTVGNQKLNPLPVGWYGPLNTLLVDSQLKHSLLVFYVFLSDALVFFDSISVCLSFHT
mgnify:FL=1